MEAAVLTASASVLTVLIKTLVPRLLSLWDKANKKYEAFQDDATFLGRELPMITSAIEGQLSGQDDHVLRLSVEELRQIAHDMEDCIDRITYLASWKQQLPRYHIRKPIKKKKSFTELGKQMGRLRKQLEEAHQRKERYYVSRPALPLSSSESRRALPLSSSEYYVHPEDLVGLQVPLEELKNHLSEQEELKQLKVITIVGFCGSGKTVLAHELYNSEVSTKFDSKEGTKSKIHTWVSAEHKDPMKLLEEMHQNLGIPSPITSNGRQLTKDQKDHLNNNSTFSILI
ncbi:unnamed protein product [Miscanthus lutarioriparius]|uniref:Uncharacterized protein n=1 Tax=Miscanthus lutarioriparius TaxID=422564 RepID=A0A811QEP2_9POAL|nr:unnamed protein product [Miscanthus lutarioriparius]